MSVIVWHYGVIGQKEIKQKEFDKIVEKGLKIYSYLRHALLPARDNQLILIDVETKEYFIGVDSSETRRKALDYFHQRPLFHYRIGADDAALFEKGDASWK